MTRLTMIIKMKNCFINSMLVIGLVIIIGSCRKDDDTLTVIDADGNSYTTVTIGSQTWMVENLKTTRYNDGSTIPCVTDAMTWNSLKTPAYCWYNNDSSSYKDTYGVIYNWYVVNTGKLCPKGWHVPSDEEWATLEIYLQNNGYNYDGTTDTDNDRATNNKIAKSLASIANWELSSKGEGVIGSINNSAYRNKSKFTAQPGGSRSAWGFVYIGYYGLWWSSSEYSKDEAFGRTLSYYLSNMDRILPTKDAGYSVRCIKDN